jgi:hypothetical protein
VKLIPAIEGASDSGQAMAEVIAIGSVDNRRPTTSAKQSWPQRCCSPRSTYSGDHPMAYSRLAARLYGAPLLITPEKAKILEEVFRAHLVGTAPKVRAMDDDYGSESEEQRAARVHQERVQRYAGIALQRRDDKPYALTQSGIALIPAMGTLIQRGSWMDSMSGLTSYDMLASMLDKSMADPDVRGALFEYDTPGGEVPGAFEFQARCRAPPAASPCGRTRTRWRSPRVTSS